jgi:short-subunit dehydrogenase
MNVVITGASRGLGKAIAHLFAKNGHDLMLTSRNEVALYNAVQEIMTVYPAITVKAKAFDLSQKDEAQAFGKWVLGHTIRIDVLVNNAGLFDPGSVYNEPDGTLEHMMAVNLFSAYHVTRSVIDHMIHNRNAAIFSTCAPLLP